MRGKDLLECMEYIDDALVQEALASAPDAHKIFRYKNNIFARWGIAAACVVVIGISAVTFWSHQNVREGQSGSAAENMAPPMARNASEGSPSGSSLTTGAAADTAAAADEGDAGYTETGKENAVSQDTAADAASASGGEDTVVQDMAEGAAVQEMAKEGKALMEEEAAKLEYGSISSHSQEFLQKWNLIHFRHRRNMDVYSVLQINFNFTRMEDYYE